MNNRMTFPIHRGTRGLLEEKGSGTLLGILLVFLPFVLVGYVGESLKTGSAISNDVINLAYVLSLGIATLILKPWGWNWRGIGLARPASWRDPASRAIGAILVTLLILVALQMIVYMLVGSAGPASDQSEYNPIGGNLPLLLGMLAVAWTTVAFGEEMLFHMVNIHQDSFCLTAASCLSWRTRPGSGRRLLAQSAFQLPSSADSLAFAAESPVRLQPQGAPARLE